MPPLSRFFFFAREVLRRFRFSFHARHYARHTALMRDEVMLPLPRSVHACAREHLHSIRYVRSITSDAVTLLSILRSSTITDRRATFI